MIESNGFHESGLTLRNGTSFGFFLDLLTFEEKIRPKFLPAVGLVGA